MKKTLKNIFLVIIILIAVSLLAHNLIIKKGLETGVKAVTGLDLTIGKVDVGILKTSAKIEDLKIYNPSNFKDRLMLDLPILYVDYSLGALLKKEIYLPQATLHLKEFAIIKNAQGELNIDSLKPVKKAEAPAAEKKEKTKKELPKLKIDLLKLKIDKVVYKDYSQSVDDPRTITFDIGIDQEYRDIENTKALAGLIISQAITNTTLGQFIDFDLSSLMQGVKGGIGSGIEASRKAIDSTLKGAEGVQQGVSGAVNATTETIKNILPFGK
jgi:uncharacterized protein involved in outer membrane biogenesis